MDLETLRSSKARRISVFKRLGQVPHVNNLHDDVPSPQPKQSHRVFDDRSLCYGLKSNRRNLHCSRSNNAPASLIRGALDVIKNTQEAQRGNTSKGNTRSGVRIVWKTQLKCAPVSDNRVCPAVCEVAQGNQSVTKSINKSQLCKIWAMGKCDQGDKCKDLHSWCSGDGFSFLAKLEGHSKAITGISLPHGSNKLYSSSKDKSLRVWDCSTGQCVGVVNLDNEIGTLISEGPLVFVGLQNAVKAFDMNTHAEFTLNELAGLVYAMVVGHNMLFVGTEDGTILAWKSGSETSSPQLTAPLKGHTAAVLSLIVSAERLYSGSMDFTIRVWDIESLQCVQTLKGHTNAVTSVLCWDRFLLSGSLDGTVKIWAASETSNNLKMVSQHSEKHGVLALGGIHDAEAKPILLCSCNDNIVRLYEMPSFSERGRIFARSAIRVIQIGTDGLFFTGDERGELFVWKLHQSGCSTVS